MVEARVHTYYLKADAASQTFQLMHADGSASPDVPVVDHVVSLAFQYDGEPRPHCHRDRRYATARRHRSRPCDLRLIHQGRTARFESTRRAACRWRASRHWRTERRSRR